MIVGYQEKKKGSMYVGYQEDEHESPLVCKWRWKLERSKPFVKKL
jgi:hypothetical protein